MINCIILYLFVMVVIISMLLDLVYSKKFSACAMCCLLNQKFYNIKLSAHNE